MGSILWFAVALLALQGSYASSRSSEDGMGVIYQYLLAQIDAIAMTEFIDAHLLAVVDNFEKVIVGATQDKEISSNLQALEETIKNLEPENDSKNCVSKALSQKTTATNELERDIKLCTNTARITEEQLRSDIEEMKTWVSNVHESVIMAMNKCLSEEEIVSDEHFNCLRENIVTPQYEINSLAKEIINYYNEAYTFTEENVQEFNTCVQDVKEDLQRTSVKIVEQLQDCLQSNSTAVKTYQKGIIPQIFKYLKHQINSIINIITNLPTSIDQIPGKIQDVISHMNIAIITNQVESEINEIIAGAGRNAKKCSLVAEKSVLVIKNTSKKEVKTSMESAHEKLAVLRSEIYNFASKTFKEANTLLVTINKQFMTCYLQHILNPVHLKKCLLSFYDQLKQNTSDLNEKVSNYVDGVKVSTDNIIKDLAQRVNEIQVKTVTEGQALIADIEKCVWTAS